MDAELNKLQKQTIDFFAKSELAKKFYWTGGTLLSAVYLHHRTSQDIDLFSDKPFNYEEVKNFIEELKKELNLENITPKKIYDRWEFLITNGEQLRIEFVFYDYPKLKSRKKWNGISIDSLFDIAVNKTTAMFERNEAKDIFDLYCLITKNHLQVKDLLRGAHKKFGLKIEEDSFWSEAIKTLKSLDKVKPFLLVESEKEKENLVEKIKDYFLSHSAFYIHRFLK